MSRTSTRKTLISMAVAGACGVAAWPALAQEGATAPAAAANRNEIPEVVVTATRHSTSLLKTPVSMTAVTQDELTRKGITDIRGLSGEVPNLQLGSATDGSSGVKISMRGVSSNDFTEIGNPAVSLHVDGIYTPRPQSALALLFDLDQVEVLRGPQGTLFGRNATGGSINIIPAKPKFGSSEGMANVAVGNYNLRQASVAQNIPVSDNFAMRVTGMAVKRDSYLNQSQDFYAANFPEFGITPARDAAGNVIPDVDQRHNVPVGADKAYGNKNEWAARLQARWKIGDRLEWLGAYERYTNNGAGDIALKDCEMAAGTAYACQGDQWDVKINVPGALHWTIDTYRSRFTWSPTSTTTVEWNSSYAVQKRRQIRDGDAGYQPLAADVNIYGGLLNDTATFTNGSKFRTTVNELQLRGETGSLRYVTGLFWMHEKNAIEFGEDDISSMVQLPGQPYYYLYDQQDRQSDSKAVFGQADWAFAPKWNLTVGGRMTRDEREDKNGKFYDSGTSGDPYSYFQGTFNPNAGRYFNSSDLLVGQGAYYGVGGLNPAIVPDISSNKDSWNKFTWRLGLSYQATPTDFLFTSLSTGYKAGGFSDKQNICARGLNGNCADMTPGPHYTFLAFKPETLTNFEIGYKGRMLDNRLTFSATAFHSRYKDMQMTGAVQAGKIIPQIPCTAATPACDAVVLYGTTNAAEAKISGLELEGKYRPWTGAEVNFSYSHLRAKVSSYPDFTQTWRDVPCGPFRETYGVPACVRYSGTDPALIGKFPVNVVGNDLPNAPRNSARIEASQEFALPGDYLLTPRVSARWQDKMYFSIQNLDNPHVGNMQNAYATYDASLRLTAPSGKWHAELYVNNLSDVFAKNNARIVDPGYVIGQYNDPRMFGLRVGAEW
ncbi:outer membrane receptor protein involved in Fe transport [Pseudoduganella lurida]|uniref:Outer membrane receptor protein involved in Fe transport n=1 Tax=Pseudoduganella lurida TaxID=1036180 RepID=A0A562RHC4_9BURK|nr:TonB-dependent receptor [Pseudoduganella lurida]TWI67760.1 outer membrane receptor protein involved in Fe transport [Pseudoduganella lurida]